jgi:hypothetical protein
VKNLEQESSLTVEVFKAQASRYPKGSFPVSYKINSLYPCFDKEKEFNSLLLYSNLQVNSYIQLYNVRHKLVYLLRQANQCLLGTYLLEILNYRICVQTTNNTSSLRVLFIAQRVACDRMLLTTIPCLGINTQNSKISHTVHLHHHSRRLRLPHHHLHFHLT